MEFVGSTQVVMKGTRPSDAHVMAYDSFPARIIGGI